MICVEVHKMNVTDVKIEEMLSWIRNQRVFKKRETKSDNQDIKILRMRELIRI